MFHLWRNQDVDYYQENVWKSPLEEGQIGTSFEEASAQLDKQHALRDLH